MDTPRILVATKRSLFGVCLRLRKVRERAYTKTGAREKVTVAVEMESVSKARV